MRLLVKVHGLEFVVPCGDGSQSVKWLGLAVAQRYALAAPHGRCRTREDAHLKQGFFLPANVLKVTAAAVNQSLSPASRIAEVCKDNDTIIVQLQQEVPVNVIGTPQFAPWTVSAFASASNQQRQRSAGGASTASSSKASFTTSADAKAHASSSFASSSAGGSHMLHADAKASGPSTDERKGKSSVEDDMKEYARAELLQQVNSGQFQSEMEVEAAFLYDWSRLRIDDLEKDLKERDAIQELLLAHFAQLNAAFMHYAVGTGEMAFGMSGHEFAHFVHECGLSHVETDRRALERIVTQSLKHDSLASLHDRGTLSRVGFVHALLRVILSQVAISSASGAKDNNAATAFRDAIEKSLQSNVAPAVTRLTSGPFRDHSHHDKMIAVFQDAKPKLLKLYAKYAQQDKPGGATKQALQADRKDQSSGSAATTTWPQLLSAHALKQMLYDAGMFSAGDTNAHDALFASAVEQSFSGLRECKLPEDQLLVFAEFLEVAARVALGVLEENDLPPRDAIKIALDALRSLPLKPVVGVAAGGGAGSRRK